MYSTVKLKPGYASCKSRVVDLKKCTSTLELVKALGGVPFMPATLRGSPYPTPRRALCLTEVRELATTHSELELERSRLFRSEFRLDYQDISENVHFFLSCVPQLCDDVVGIISHYVDLVPVATLKRKRPPTKQTQPRVNNY